MAGRSRVISVLSSATFLLTLLLSVAASLGIGSQDFPPEEIIAHIRYLASDELEGREAGTRGGREAARYIAGRFKEIGLGPIGEGGGYEQGFGFPSGVEFSGENRLAFSSEGERLDLVMGRDFHPLGISSAGWFSGGVVFAGYGISAPKLGYDDYAGMDVAGKAVIVLRFAPQGKGGKSGKSGLDAYAPLRRKMRTARDRGAAAILFVTPSYKKEPQSLYDYAMTPGSSDAGIRAVIVRRPWVDRLLKKEGFSLGDIEKGLKPGSNRSFRLAHTTVDMALSLKRTSSSTSNVVGVIEPPSGRPAGGVIVIGAHYDHIGHGGRSSRQSGAPGAGEGNGGAIHNGADDNASGVAGLLSLARYFAANREGLRRRLVFIAFGAEEKGLLGSSYYVKNPIIPLSETVAMINMDMIGRLRGDKLTILGIGSSTGWRRIVDEANAGVGLKLIINESGFAPSDQSAFLSKRIPSVQFFTGLHPDYHTPQDDWNKINAEGEARVLRLIAGVIKRLGRTGKAMSYAAASGGEKGSGLMSFRVYLGTIPDYSAVVRGVKLMGVKPGSPAERAGLRGDDVIVGFDGKEVRNIYDFVYTLSDSEPGVLVKLNVMRGDKSLVLSVVPEGRHGAD